MRYIINTVIDRTANRKRIMKIIKIKPATCNCVAYAFPHRVDGGKCFGKEPDSCSDCEFSSIESDPYGTGDHWYELASCENTNGCPWNKD